MECWLSADVGLDPRCHAGGAAPKQRNTNAEKADLRGKRPPQDWQDKPSKLSHKDRHARWTLKFTKAKRQDDGTIPATDFAIPFFGYRSHVSIDRKFRLDPEMEDDGCHRQ